MVLIPAKQIRKLIDAPLVIRNFAPAGSDDNVTPQLTTLLGTAGDGGRPVPVQPATTGPGLVLGKCRLIWAADKTSVVFSDGKLVHGVLSFAAAVFTVSYFETNADGSTTPISFVAGEGNIDIELFYRFDFNSFPTSAFSSTLERLASLQTKLLYWEVLEVTALNTLAPMQDYASGAENLWLVVNGIQFDPLAPDPAFSYDESNSQITWNDANAGFDLEPSDRVVVYYV